MPCSSDGYDPPKRRGGVKCNYCGSYNAQVYKGHCPQCSDESDDETDSSASDEGSDCSDDEESNDEADISGYGTLDGTTRAACEMAALIRAGWKGANGFKMLSAPTRAWVEKHDEIDKQRLERERERKERKRLKEKALSKLSSKERKALGL